MSPPILNRRVVSLLLAVAGCASGAAGPRAAAPPPVAAAPVPAAAPAAAPTAAAPGAQRPAQPARALGARAQGLWEQAVAVAEEQQRLKVPTDWEVLERRWRAVVDAEAVPEAWFNLGVCLERLRRLDEARAAYRRALELDPALSPAACNLALLDEPADPRQAAQAWGELVRRFPADPVPRARLAALYLSAGQADEAWKLAREALVRDPRAVGAYKVMMRVALERGQADLVQLLAVKARKLDAADPELEAVVGDALARQKDEAGAVAQWRKAVALRGDYLPARRALLADAWRKQHWEGVAEQAGAILKADPADARAELALGVAYRYLGQPDKALAAYQEAERLAQGRLAEVHLARGVLLMKAKDQCEPALAELDRFIAAAGPALAAETAAMRLQRECQQIVAANRQAAEAAREMKAEAEREAARKAAGQKPGAAAVSASPAPGPTATAAAAGSGGGEPRTGTRAAEAAPSDMGRDGPTR